jgi:hypothetical protein
LEELTMRTSIALPSLPHPVHITTPPACPQWCGHHRYAPAWPVGDDYCVHETPEWTIRAVCPDGLVDIVVMLDRFDDHGQIGRPGIAITARHHGPGYEGPDKHGALDGCDVFGPNVARQLAAALLELADAAEVTR